MRVADAGTRALHTRSPGPGVQNETLDILETVFVVTFFAAFCELVIWSSNIASPRDPPFSLCVSND